MRYLPHWEHPRTVAAAESTSGVLVTVDPADNLVNQTSPWPAPEVLQKLYASTRFQGRTLEDQSAAIERLGYYSDMQSLNSEDAITWSFFGNLSYAPPPDRLHVLNELLKRLEQPPETEAPSCWLWRRIPHPEKPESNGGPEIDFGLLTGTTLVLGEAKWNSKLGTGQGVEGNRSQLYLRARYCDTLARRALPTVRRFLVLGVGRSANVFHGSDAELNTNALIGELSWRQVAECFPPSRGLELQRYLDWKSQHSSGSAA